MTHFSISKGLRRAGGKKARVGGGGVGGGGANHVHPKQATNPGGFLLLLLLLGGAMPLLSSVFSVFRGAACTLHGNSTPTSLACCLYSLRVWAAAPAPSQSPSGSLPPSWCSMSNSVLGLLLFTKLLLLLLKKTIRETSCSFSELNLSQ